MADMARWDLDLEGNAIVDHEEMARGMTDDEAAGLAVGGWLTHRTPPWAGRSAGYQASVATQ